MPRSPIAFTQTVVMDGGGGSTAAINGDVYDFTISPADPVNGNTHGYYALPDSWSPFFSNPPYADDRVGSPGFSPSPSGGWVPVAPAPFVLSDGQSALEYNGVPEPVGGGSWTVNAVTVASTTSAVGHPGDIAGDSFSAVTFTQPARNRNVWGGLTASADTPWSYTYTDSHGVTQTATLVSSGATIDCYNGWGGSVILNLPMTAGGFVDSGRVSITKGSPETLGAESYGGWQVDNPYSLGVGFSFWYVDAGGTYHSGTGGLQNKFQVSGTPTFGTIVGHTGAGFQQWGIGITGTNVPANTVYTYTFTFYEQAIDLNGVADGRKVPIATLTVRLHTGPYTGGGGQPPPGQYGQPFAAAIHPTTGMAAICWRDALNGIYVSTNAGILIGGGTSNWTAGVNVVNDVGPNLSYLGICYNANGLCGLTYKQLTLTKRKTNKMMGTGTVSDWGTATAIAFADRISETGVDAQGMSYNVIANEDLMSGNITFARGYDPDSMVWSVATTVYSSTARGPWCGAAWIGTGWGVLWTEDTTSKIFWSSSPDGVSWTVQTPFTGMYGTVIGMVRLAHGTLVALIWNIGTGITTPTTSPDFEAFFAARSYDNGKTWEKDTTHISLIPVSDYNYDNEPVLLAHRDWVVAVWVNTSGLPTSVASQDAGKTWS